MKESISEKALSVIVDLIAENKSKQESIQFRNSEIKNYKSRISIGDLVFCNVKIGRVTEIHDKKIVLETNDKERIEVTDGFELQNLEKLNRDHIRIYLMYESKKPKQ